MDGSLKPNQWYRLELQMGKIFLAEFRIDKESEEGWFFFSDGSSKQVDTILPYLASIIEIDRPGPGENMDIYEFLE